jgi:hypothetical protein
MSAVLPDEFPFKRRPAPAPQSAPQPIPSREITVSPAPPPPPPTVGSEPWQLLGAVQTLAAHPQFAAQTPPIAPPPIPAPAPAAVKPSPTPQRILVEEPLVQVELAGRVVYTGPERRRSPRQNLRTKALYKPEHASTPAGPVHINNLSMLGVRFWSKTPIRQSDRGSLKLEVGPLRWSSKLKVVSCLAAEDEQGYVIGAEFVSNELPRGRTATAA